MRILVVEDYAPLRTAVVKALREEGHAVDEADDGPGGLAYATTEEYDVIVLDLMLPGLDGFAVLERLRKARVTGHVLIVTARDEVDDRVPGLDLAADDHMVKPFAMKEMLARVRALVRRAYVRKSPILTIGHVCIHTDDHTVEVAGEAVEFTAKEYALLEYLALRTDQVVSRTEIWEHLYDDRSSVTSNVVDVYIGYVRKKIEGPDLPRLLHTRRGEGYIITGERT